MIAGANSHLRTACLIAAQNGSRDPESVDFSKGLA